MICCAKLNQRACNKAGNSDYKRTPRWARALSSPSILVAAIFRRIAFVSFTAYKRAGDNAGDFGGNCS